MKKEKVTMVIGGLGFTPTDIAKFKERDEVSRLFWDRRDLLHACERVEAFIDRVAPRSGPMKKAWDDVAGDLRQAIKKARRGT